MSVDGICGVVVTYFPDAEVMANLCALRLQLRRVVVVDNGSPAESFAGIRAAGFAVIENETNMGIATALNQGIRWAREQGCEWVFLFDQDSRVTEGYVGRMLAGFEGSEFGDRLGILVPRYVDRRFGSVLKAPRGKGVGLEAATTSGSLTPMRVFEAAGLFAEELFIDGVDYEFSLRVRRLGFAIDECVKAELLHSPGTPQYHTMLGKRFQVANYSPVRRYYQERNKIWVAKRYWRDFLGFCLGQFLISAKDLLKIVLVEEDKARKCRFFLRGVRDGLRGRTGRLE